MAMTDEEKQQIKQEVLAEIESSSIGVTELEEVSSLSGVNSLPAMSGAKVVRVPISLLSKPAEDAAASVNKLIEQADSKFKELDSLTDSTKSAAESASKAAATAEAVTKTVTEALNSLNGVAGELRGTVVNVNRVLNTTSSYEDVVAAANALVAAGITAAQQDGVVLIFRTAKGWTCKQFTGDPTSQFTTAANWRSFGSGSGSGSGFYNVTLEQPLAEGFYTLETAVAALANAEVEDDGKRGMIITFEAAAGDWREYRFTATSIDSFLTPAGWEEYGAKGAVKQVTFNGEKLTPDPTGNISLNVDVPETDETLDPESTNPIQNAAVAAAIDRIEANTVFSMGAEVSDDESTVRLTLNNKSGAEIASVDIPAGSGGGGGDASATKIVLNASVDKAIVKEGDSARLTYTYDHQYSAGDEKGESTGQKATITLTLLRGSATLYTQSIQNVGKGSYTFDLGPYLAVGTTDIYVKATTTDPASGRQQTKQGYVSVRVVTLSLSSSYNLASSIASGGYAASDTVTIPFAVSGSGTKIVTMYLDGVQKDSREVSKSGTTNGSFSISMIGLAAGRHTVQMVAEMEADESLTLKSESVYIDFLKAGSSAPFIGTMMRFADGRIFSSAEYRTPRISVGQYEQLSFEFVVYDPATTPATMSVYRDDAKTQTVSVPRTVQQYVNRFTEQEQVEMMFLCGSTSYLFNVDVTASDIDISEATDALTLKLSAAGRSNTESNPAEWSYGDVRTTFEGFDWNSSGWTGETLKMMNGASIEIGFRPFAADAATTGATYEFELNCSNVTEREGEILSCLANGIGFRMTTQDASMTASAGTSVSTKFAADMDLHIGFVVQQKNGTRLMELYVNGIRCGAKQYATSESFLQETPATISVRSNAADVELRSIRVYEKALTDDEMLSNFIVDRTTTDEMVSLFENNEVMDDEGLSVDIEKLRAKGKSVIRIVGDVDLVNQTNNKKFEVPVDVYFYSAYGPEYDFIAQGVGLRIQGTSSTTYPRKNYRLYFDRADKYGTTLTVNGSPVPDLSYSFKPGARPVKIFCLKADFSDSSSTHNTGAVRLVNDVWKKCGFLTPPQAAYEGEYDVRIGVDGFPCDGFYDEDGSGTNGYLGKFNFNNEKSESHQVYGFEGIEGFNDEEALAGGRNKCICLEFLNNSKPLCLFATDDMSEFDDALEFRYKADTVWADAHEEDRAAVQRLWSWVYACKDDPERFAAEVSQYFDVNSLCAWYLFTDYFMAVDQRAKNMMLATWDGLKWYFLPYDADTILGGRNDAMLAYDYTITEETYDDSIGSYAFAGHDSVLWKLVREALSDKLMETAATIRSNMSTESVLEMFNVEQMGNWSERIYNKDGYFKYIQPLIEGVQTTEGTKFYDYLYALQGSRYAHRVFTIKNRFALLDAMYVAGTYRSDSFTAYFGYAFSGDNRKIKITSSERYYFGYGYTSGTPHQSAVLAPEAGSQIFLTLDTDLIVNDPQYIYGASRIRELDLTDVSHALLQTLNLNNCTALRVLDVSCSAGQSTLNALLVAGCKNLRSLNMGGLQSASFTTIDLSTNSKLETFRASKSALTGVTFAQGSPLTSAVLPATIQTLELRYLAKLSNAGLTLEGTSNVTRLVVDGCTLLDWKQIYDRCANVKYLRVTGVNMEGDGTLLRNLLSVGGVDEAGGNTPTCRLVGTYRLTNYLEDALYEELREHFPELNIIQPEWTCIEFDDSVLDGHNISNLDNHTGYAYDNDYAPSAHISKILAQRHRVLGKKTAEGEVTICQLHDENSNYYADAEDPALATPAVLTGAEGNVWMFEPHYWYKGVNDLLNQKKYSFFSSNAECPVVDGQYVKFEKDDLEVVEGMAIRIGEEYETLEEAATAVPADSYCAVDIPAGGYRQARFPSLSSAAYGGVWLDSAGRILGRMRATSSAGILNGMYLFASIPEGAVRLAFTIVNAADFDYVLFTTSDKVEAIEPDWCEHTECLTAVYEALLQDDLVKSVSGEISTGSVSQGDLMIYASNSGPGFQLVDWDMHKDVANLFYAKYGTRDSQGQCGYGQSSYTKRSGLTNLLGMRDTINPENKTSGAYYYEGDTLKDILSTNVMGYECWQGNKCEWLGYVTLNKEKANGRWSIETPGRPPREVQGIAVFTEYWPANMVHGRYMDIIVARGGGSETSGYYDYQPISGAIARVVYRSSYYAVAYGGVSFAITFNDSSSTTANIGSRLAFRGQIVKATSVSEYKASPSVE